MFDGDAELIQIQVTIERYQNRFRIRRKLILDNTGQCCRALPLAALGFFGSGRDLLRRQCGRVDQASMLPPGNVIGPKVVSVLVVGTAFEIRHEFSVR